MPKYREISKIENFKSDGVIGTLYEVELIPDDGNSEIQKYFVRSEEAAVDVLSAASINHDTVLVARKQPIEPVAISDPVEAKV